MKNYTVDLDTVDDEMAGWQEYLQNAGIVAEKLSGMEVRYTGSKASLEEMIRVWWLDEYLLSLIVEVK